MFTHTFPFDPTYGYDRERLLTITAPEAPPDFDAFWRDTFDATMRVPPRVELRDGRAIAPGWDCRELRYDTLGGRRVGGWLVTPGDGVVRRAVVMGHGYGGRETPTDFDHEHRQTAFLLTCAPGFHISASPGVPNTPARHVLHGIASRETYILRDCVAAIWSAVTVVQQLRPVVADRVFYAGGSFGGGLGALALPWDARIKRGYLAVPTFGHHPIRLSCPCNGSGEAVRLHHQRHPDAARVLAYFDAASAATRIRVPTLTAPAMFDPAVPPPGQFAVCNAVAGETKMFVLSAGHFEYADSAREHAALGEAVREWLA